MIQAIATDVGEVMNEVLFSSGLPWVLVLVCFGIVVFVTFHWREEVRFSRQIEAADAATIERLRAVTPYAPE